PRRADRGARRARLALPARLRARRARSRQGRRLLDALPRRGRAPLRSHRPHPPRTPAGRGQPGRAARPRGRRLEPRRGVPAIRGARGTAMKLADVGLVAAKELRETLRDRRTIVVMVLFPLVVYPLVSLLMAQVTARHTAKGEARRARV